MTIQDFTECRYIENCMRFADIFDFARVCRIIKRKYNKLTPDAKFFYKYYIYAHINTSDKEKNIIWEYLNDDRQSITEYIDYLSKKKKCDII